MFRCQERVAKETFWKCPNANQCVSSFKFCSSFNFANAQYYSLGSCPNISEASRKVCENPQKYNISLNCEERGFFKCTGHREQCILTENVCDGFLQCMDRSDESNCSQNIKELNYNIFIPCKTDKMEHGFKCDDKLCVPLQYWCMSGNLYHVPNLNQFINVCPQLISTMKNELLCQNKTFWQNKPCDSPFGDKRCSGNYPGECSFGRGIAFKKRSLAIFDPCLLTEIEPFKDHLCKDISNFICNKNAYQNACNQGHMHLCKDNLTCIHNNLVCDGYVHCPDGSDEVDEICMKCPRIFGFPMDKLKDATFPCKHRYTGKFICSVPCDGNDDLCLDNEDETCQGDTIIVTVIAGVLLILTTITIGEIILLNQNVTKKESFNLSNLIDFITFLNLPTNSKQKHLYRDLKSIHGAIDYSATVSMLMTFFSAQEKDEAREIAVNFFNFEKKHHKGNLQALHLCLKEHLESNQNSNLFYGLIEPVSLPDLIQHKIDLCLKVTNISLKKMIIVKDTIFAFIRIIFYYTDLIKDMVIIFLFIQYFPESETDFSSFPIQVLILLCVSVALPAIVNQILMLCDNPLQKGTSKKLRILLQIFAPLAPAISVYVHARLSNRKKLVLTTKSKQQHITDHDVFLELHNQSFELESESQKWIKFLSKLRLSENVTEHVIQTIFLIIVILLKFSSTSTITGFQDLFAGKEIFILALSALWSNISIILGYLNSVIIKKDQHMTMLGKQLIVLFSFISLSGRVFAVILYFSPSLGLMNLIMHWKMGKKLINSQSNANTGIIYDVNATTGEKIIFSDMWKPMNSLTELTILSLETYFKIFLGLVFLHFFSMLIVKFVYSENFQKMMPQTISSKFFQVIIQASFKIIY